MLSREANNGRVITSESPDQEGSKLKYIRMDQDIMMNSYIKRRKYKTRGDNTILNVSLKNHTLHHIAGNRQKKRNQDQAKSQRNNNNGPHILSLNCKPDQVAKYVFKD